MSLRDRLFKPKPIPKYCPWHGCELVDKVAKGESTFDSYTGEGWRWTQNYKECPNQDKHYGRNGRWYYGPKIKEPAQKECP